MKWLRNSCWMLLAVLTASTAAAAPVGTGFTYQGKLILNGNPVNGPTTLRFRLFDALAGGNQVGGNILMVSVPVTDGMFTVVLNASSQFGPTAFKGDARWLEIAVCDDPLCSSSTVLSPRQEITAAPYALHSVGPWLSNSTSLTYLTGNVGIGRQDPQAKLELESGFDTEVLRFGHSSSNYHHFTTGFHGEQAPLNYLGFNISHGHNDTRRVMTLQGTGNVGIGTPSPTAKLQVVGNVALGPNGEFSAAAGNEQLRMLRGAVSSTGGIFLGDGFSVTRVSTGIYQINFFTPFAGTPCVTATPYNHGLENRFCGIIQQGPGSVQIVVHNNSASEVDWGFHFCVIGPR